MELKIFSIILTIISLKSTVASPVNSNTNDKSQTVISDEVTAYPDMQKRYIDLSNVSPDVSSLLRQNKLDIDRIREQQERLRNRNSIENDKNRYEVFSSSTAPTISKNVNNEESYRLLKIQSELEATLRAENTDSNDHVSSSKLEKPQFEYAFAAACEMPRHMNISRWFEGKTWNIMFKPIYRRYNVISSTIRLYKINKDEDVSKSNECDSLPGDMYTITVSVYIRKRKEIKKKIIFTRVIPATFTGWVEIDALGTLSYWDQAKNNHGIAVDVYDDNDEPLDAREHFRLQNCNKQAAEPVLPWNAFEFLAVQSTGTVTNAHVERFQQMYSHPRLDITSSTPPIYDTNSNLSLNKKSTTSNGIQQDHVVENDRPQRHIRHENHHKHHVQNDSTVTLLKNKFHKRREHLHRDDNSTTSQT